MRWTPKTLLPISTARNSTVHKRRIRTMSARIPPTKLVRLVERARHRLALIHLRMVPPYAAMMELIVSSWTSQAITVAVELGIADALDKGPLRLEELASRVEADPDALRRLLRALIGRGIFRQRRDGRYALNALAKSLRANAPLSAAAMAEMVGSAQHREHWSHLTDSIQNRQGGHSGHARHGSLRVPRSGARIQCSLQPRHGRHHRDGGGLPDWPPTRSTTTRPLSMSAAGWAGCFVPSSRRPRLLEGFSTTCRTPSPKPHRCCVSTMSQIEWSWSTDRSSTAFPRVAMSTCSR